MGSNKTAPYPKQDARLGLAKEKIGGRFVTSYNPALALEVLELVAQGKTINAICKLGTKFPHPVTFKRWVVNNPELARALDVARRMSAEAIEEEALDVARAIKDNQRDGTQVRAHEVLLQQLRWSAERRDPAKYGTRTPVSIRVPIQINTTLDMGKGEAEIHGGGDIYKITATTAKSVDTAVIESRQGHSTNPIAEGLESAKRLNFTPTRGQERAQDRGQDQEQGLRSGEIGDESDEKGVSTPTERD